MDKHKLGVIIPYRNRLEHLSRFLTCIKTYLNLRKINYEIIVINQDNGKQFNRGMLLNIGFTEAVKLECDYVVFTMWICYQLMLIIHIQKYRYI